jgi:hypothetical protein
MAVPCWPIGFDLTHAHISLSSFPLSLSLLISSTLSSAARLEPFDLPPAHVQAHGHTACETTAFDSGRARGFTRTDPGRPLIIIASLAGVNHSAASRLSPYFSLSTPAPVSRPRAHPARPAVTTRVCPVGPGALRSGAPWSYVERSVMEQCGWCLPPNLRQPSSPPQLFSLRLALCKLLMLIKPAQWEGGQPGQQMRSGQAGRRFGALNHVWSAPLHPQKGCTYWKGHGVLLL